MDPDDAIRALDKNHLMNDRGALAELNSTVIEEFRRTGGTVGGTFEGANILLMTLTGAKSGRPRLTPMEYLMVDDQMIVVGSYGGSPTHPAWVHNLRACPRVHIDLGGDSYDAVARELVDDDRDRVFARIVEVAPRFAEYQERTSRRLPVFVLRRADPRQEMH